MVGSHSMADVLRNQGRGVAGALLVVGLPVLYTMETWYLGWRLPLSILVAYALAGLGVVFVLVRRVGFRQEERERTQRDVRRILTSFTELLLQSFVAAYLLLLALGVIEGGDPPMQIARLGLIHVVPLGFGAAIANRLLAAGDDRERSSFPGTLATFGLGSVFVAFPLAPTREMALLAARTGWLRLAALVVLAVVLVHLVLHELEFRGHHGRIAGRTKPEQFGTTLVAYAVGVAISVGFLGAFGHFAGTTLAEWVQQTIVLSLPASVGASAGEVVL